MPFRMPDLEWQEALQIKSGAIAAPEFGRDPGHISPYAFILSLVERVSDYGFAQIRCDLVDGMDKADPLPLDLA